ncbi:alpha/beta hydrolase [Polaribacter sp. ALD11]|nr:alpha/beta hydrolase [Polaribacter sp. ALD11]
MSIIVLVFLIIYFFQERFIFKNGERIHGNYLYNFLNSFEEIFIKIDGNSIINALHFKLKKPKGIILFCHGNSGNLQKWGNRVSYFLDYNYEVFVFDYRNYGKSTGNFNEAKMYNDALLMYNHIKKSYKEDTIVVYGFSLGSTFATRIASINNPKELILEAPFFNFKKAVQYYSKFAPIFLLKYKFRTDLDIVKVTSPITIFHGNKDQITSFKDAKTLLELNTLKENIFIQIDGGTHHNIRENKLYELKLQEILER